MSVCGYGLGYPRVTGLTLFPSAELALARARVVLEKFFEGHAFDWERQVIIASSHGRTPRCYKISYRLVVTGFRMTMAAVKARLVAVDTEKLFDPAPYNKTQKLRAVGAIKAASDRRVMDLARRPITAELLGTTLVRSELVVIEVPGGSTLIFVFAAGPGRR